jgi:hypothetical protein
VATLVVAVTYLPLCFTWVEEGTSKQVVRFGAFTKSLLSKRGYKYNPEWNLEKVEAGESLGRAGFLGGLRWVSWVKPLGIDRIYTRTMKFIKTLPKGQPGKPEIKYEKREDEGTDFLLTGTQYQYALLFDSAEDANGLALSGQMTLTAQICNPYKALFLVRDWFDALISRVLPRVRQYISEHTYEDIIKKHEVQLDKDVLEILKKPDDTDVKKRNILQILKDDYGIELIALETVNVDPPKEYRETSLKKYVAEQEAASRRIERLGSTTGAMLAMIADFVGLKIEDLQTEFKASPDGTLQKYKGIIAMNQEFVLRQMGLDAGAVRQYYFQGGSGGLDLVALLGDVFRGSAPTPNQSAPSPSRKKGQQQGQGSQQGGQQGGQGSSGKTPEQAAEEFFQQRGIYPPWDPKGRGGKTS